MFFALGISGFLPMRHAATEFGVLQARRQMGWGWFVLEAVFYISGTAIYILKYPEKARPGTFDLFGSSHQIFHLLVLFGAGAHLVGIIQAFEYNHNPYTRMCPGEWMESGASGRTS
jgi:adiponectin receptor